MTPQQLSVILAAPLDAANWQEVDELTPSQLASILAAIQGSVSPAGHLITGGPPPVVTYQGGDGGALVSSAGRDSAGQAVVTTGTGSLLGGVLLRVTFATAFTAAPSVLVEGIDATTAALGISLTVTTAYFEINAPSAGFPATTTYSWNWAAVGSPS
jgi:hypothetical protein